MPKRIPTGVHSWEWCGQCRCAMVICGKCGNNTCNAGHGTFIVDAPKSLVKRYKWLETK
jgi:hypothetical protein